VSNTARGSEDCRRRRTRRLTERERSQSVCGRCARCPCAAVVHTHGGSGSFVHFCRLRAPTRRARSTSRRAVWHAARRWAELQQARPYARHAFCKCSDSDNGRLPNLVVHCPS
jgi:hypothetical protein